MRADVPKRAGSGKVLFHAPDQREIGVENPVLQVLGTEVADLPELAVVDQPLGELHRGHATIVEVDHRDGARLAGGRQHLLRFFEGVGERLFAEDVLSGFERGDHDLLVGEARC